MFENRRTRALILIAICLLAFFLRSFFFNVPFERDEGAFGYIAQQWLTNGLLPYRDILEEKPILVYLIYMLPLKLFGADSFVGVRVFTAFYSLLTLIALYLVTKRMYGVGPAFWAALCYAYFSTGPRVAGFGSNTETFLVLPLTIGLYSFWCCEEKSKILLSAFLGGLFCGIGFLIKQVAVFHLMALIIYLWWRKRFLKAPLCCLLGFFLPWSIVAICFASQHLFSSLFAHTIMSVIARVSGDYSTTLFIRNNYFEMVVNRASWVLCENLVLWIFAGLIIIRFLASERLPKNMLLLSWFFFSLSGVGASGRFYGHHFIEIIPILALLAGYSLHRVFVDSFGLSRNFVVTTAILTFLSGLAVDYNYYFRDDPGTVSRDIYNTAAFTEAVKVGKYIKERTDPQDYIYVWGAEPEICFYAQRRSSSRFVNFYSISFEAEADTILGSKLKKLLWAHLSDRQESEMKRLEITKPKYIILSAPLQTDFNKKYPIKHFLGQMLLKNYIYEGAIGDQSKYDIYRLKEA